MTVAARAFNWASIPMLNNIQDKGLISQMKVKKVKRNAYLFRENEKTNAVFVLIEGVVFIEQLHPEEGTDYVKYIVKEAELFGEKRIWSAQPMNESAVARSKEVIYGMIPIEVFQKFMFKDKTFTEAVFNRLLKRLKKIEVRCQSLKNPCTRQRLKNLLLFMMPEDEQRQNQVTLNHYLSKKEMANMVRATAQTMSSILNDWQRKNILDYNRFSVTIRDYERFMSL